MPHANKTTDIHRTRVGNGTPLTRRSGTRISRGGIGGLGLRDLGQGWIPPLGVL
jgi:hypothetical protein